MSVVSKLHVMRIKHRGIFDMGGLFRTMRSWMIDQGYEFHETTAKHRVPSPAGATEEFVWSGWRRVNGYVVFRIRFWMRAYEVKDVEVVRGGKKKHLTQGAIWIEITPSVELDYQNRFGGSRFLQKVQDFYHHHVIKHNIQDIWEDEVYYRAYKLHRIIKEYLDFETKTNASEGRW